MICDRSVRIFFPLLKPLFLSFCPDFVAGSGSLALVVHSLGADRQDNKDKLPSDVLRTQLEAYLSEDEFKATFKMPPDQFSVRRHTQNTHNETETVIIWRADACILCLRSAPPALCCVYAVGQPNSHCHSPCLVFTRSVQALQGWKKADLKKNAKIF